jgi:peptidoglycan/xylan/chitin deacetylase (PgdA/CDA1 family)
MGAALARRAFSAGPVRRAALRLGAARGLGLVLLFHRLGDEEATGQRLVPSVREPVFRRQLEALLQAGDIVPLEALLAPVPERRRPRFALTFDDDWLSHHERALPVLRSLGVTATFFLSGRALHGLGPLWFERLDLMVATRGVRAAADWLRVDVSDLEQLALACENDTRLQRRMEELPELGVQGVTAAHIQALAASGMTIGFHTLHHPLLPRLSEAALDVALVEGRRELEAAAGRPVRLFAYPHGKPFARAAERLARAGFVAACTGQPRPVRAVDDPYLLGRWEPGGIEPDAFMAGVARRLNGWRRPA